MFSFPFQFACPHLRWLTERVFIGLIARAHRFHAPNHRICQSHVCFGFVGWLFFTMIFKMLSFSFHKALLEHVYPFSSDARMARARSIITLGR